MVTSVNNLEVFSTEPIIALDENFNSNDELPSVNFHALGLDDDISQYKLKEAHHEFVLSMQAEIPFIIWLLENPKSALALPGKVDLFGHDCIHLLLNRGKSNFDEAFVIGFTMGNDVSTKERHVKIFEMFATKFYPPLYRFNQYHMKSFYLGLKYGQDLACKDINLINFKLYSETRIQTLRDSLGINLDDLKKLCAPEKLWIQMAAAFS